MLQQWHPPTEHTHTPAFKSSPVRAHQTKKHNHQNTEQHWHNKSLSTLHHAKHQRPSWHTPQHNHCTKKTHPQRQHSPHSWWYKKIADSIIAAAVTMTSWQAPPCPAQDGPTIGIEKVYWHGFTIITGYGMSSRATPYNSVRGRGAGTHPYRC